MELPWTYTNILVSSFVLFLALDSVDGELHQRFDGWYNNLMYPDWGSVNSDLVSKVTPAFSDLTYRMSGPKRPNARKISNDVLQGSSGLPSYFNRTTMFVFIGQLITIDMVRASKGGCPVEVVKVPVPDDDPVFLPNADGSHTMPFTRAAFNEETGQSPNKPRKALNQVTSWLDANFIYGQGQVWSNLLREGATGGKLASSGKDENLYPGLNTFGLPLENFPNPLEHELTDVARQWTFGAYSGHQTPPLTALQVTWFRYHNLVASRLQKENPDWSDGKLFRHARRYVIAVWQKIVFYDWLPLVLGESLPEYKGYNPYIQPGVSAIFSAAAFRFGHSMIPPGIYIRNNQCQFRRPDDKPALRLCNTYWRSQELLEKYGVDEVLLGMSSQIAEREDHILVEDIRGNTFGPLHYSRNDVAVLNIMRGRDYGLPDYNTARRSFGLPEIKDWGDLNTDNSVDKKFALEALKSTYNGSLDNLDIFPAGLLEYGHQGMGPLFFEVVRDQFLRVRDGDRFWFENKDSRVAFLSDADIDTIWNTTLRDVILSVTNIDEDAIQKDVFHWKQGNPCPQPMQLTEDALEACTPHRGYDYFNGSEIPYVIGFTSLFIFPFVCILVAYVYYKYRHVSIQDLRMRFSMVDNASGKKRQSTSSEHSGGDDRCIGQEWLGKGEPTRQVWINFLVNEAQLSIRTMDGIQVRSVNLSRLQLISVWLSSDSRRNVLLLQVPKAIDLVVAFQNGEKRLSFLRHLDELLVHHDKVKKVMQCPEKYIWENAITKRRRQELLTKFFRGAVAEAYELDNMAPESSLKILETREIIECELSREEFAEAFSMPADSGFVTQMFAMMDREGKEYITFRDMLHVVAFFTQGSAEQKLQILFLMYDVDKDGQLSREEMAVMIRSMMELAHMELGDEELQRLVHSMLDETGLEDCNYLTLEEFKKMMAPHSNLFDSGKLHLKGESKVVKKASSRRTEGPRNMIMNRQDKRARFKEERINLGNISERMKYARHYFENMKLHIAYVFIFFSVCAVVFAEMFYKYTVEKEHLGYRKMAGYGIGLSRGGASGLAFCFSFLLLTMCRNLITALRETALNLYIPFDAHVAFHKLVAYTGLFFTVLHILGYCFNLYSLVTQPVEYLCVFNGLYFRSGFLPTFTWWLFGNMTGATGYLLVLTICIIFVFSTTISRRYIFSAFWTTHQLFYLLYVLIFLHGCSRIIQDPIFPYYFIGPGVLFTVDKIISLSRKHRAVEIIRAYQLPSNVLRLVFKRPANFEYKSGQWVRVAAQDLDPNEFHPFTLTSSPHEETLSLHIRAVGPWTHNIRELFKETRGQVLKQPKRKLYIDGPFGAGQQDWYKFDVSVLVGGGIGVTPYASILKDFVAMTAAGNKFKVRCKKLYFIWVNGGLRQWEWMLDILRQVEQVDEANVVDIHIFITQLPQRFDLRTTMLYICEQHFQKLTNRSMFTGLSALTHFGRPVFHDVFCEIANIHNKVRNIGVFSCGPRGLTKGVEEACHSASSSKALFTHHYENF